MKKIILSIFIVMSAQLNGSEIPEKSKKERSIFTLEPRMKNCNNSFAVLTTSKIAEERAQVPVQDFNKNLLWNSNNKTLSFFQYFIFRIIALYCPKLFLRKTTGQQHGTPQHEKEDKTTERPQIPGDSIIQPTDERGQIPEDSLLEQKTDAYRAYLNRYKPEKAPAGKLLEEEVLKTKLKQKLTNLEKHLAHLQNKLKITLEDLERAENMLSDIEKKAAAENMVKNIEKAAEKLKEVVTAAETVLTRQEGAEVLEETLKVVKAVMQAVIQARKTTAAAVALQALQEEKITKAVEELVKKFTKKEELRIISEYSEEEA